MRILVTGASGLLGLNLSLSVIKTHQVIGVDRSRLVGVPFELLNLDLLEENSIEKMFSASTPDCLIHCAALADVDACEKDPVTSKLLNASLPEKLALACANHSVPMLHISTDAVFDGTQDSPYQEEDTPNPLGVYAATKLEAERSVLRVFPKAIVARVNFYGWSLSGSRSLAEFFVNNLQAGNQINGFTDLFFCPMFVGDLAQTLIKMLSKGLSGLYHVVGSEPLSKFDFGIAIARQFGYDSSLIQPVSVAQSNLVARRSPNLNLSTHKLSTALGEVIPGFSTGLSQFYTQFQLGYPQQLAGYQHISPAAG
ncbi:SDR family oxidoreductase [Chloroflexota bacterium]